jgi:hypothetical protein
MVQSRLAQELCEKAVENQWISEIGTVKKSNFLLDRPPQISPGFEVNLLAYPGLPAWATLFRPSGCFLCVLCSSSGFGSSLYY